MRLKMVHRDVAFDRNYSGHRHRLEALIGRDKRRVAGLSRRLSPAWDDFGSEVVSGMEEGSGEYFVRIGVGSPARSQYMVIDSGSDLVWVQCRPCSPCYKQANPLFDPSMSVSFSGVPCRSAVCGLLDHGRCLADRCGYEVSYLDGSFTKGVLAMETLTVGTTEVRDVAIGCGHSNSGLFVGAAGLLGLGAGALSFVGQLAGQTGGAFGYCLVTRGRSTPPVAGGGFLIFGRGALPVGAAWVPLLRNPNAPSFYYVGLAGVGVGGQPVALPETAFGERGALVDTGTAVTRLPAAAYEALRDAFTAAAPDLRRAEGAAIFDTCYDLSGVAAVLVPSVSFFFSGGVEMILPARNFMIPVDEVGKFCFAFASSPAAELAIIGNIQQQGIQISFDVANGFLGFGPNSC